MCYMLCFQVQWEGFQCHLYANEALLSDVNWQQSRCEHRMDASTGVLGVTWVAAGGSPAGGSIELTCSGVAEALLQHETLWGSPVAFAKECSTGDPPLALRNLRSLQDSVTCGFYLKPLREVTFPCRKFVRPFFLPHQSLIRYQDRNVTLHGTILNMQLFSLILEVLSTERCLE